MNALIGLPVSKWSSQDDVIRTLRTDRTITKAQWEALAKRLAWMMTPADVDRERRRNWQEQE